MVVVYVLQGVSKRYIGITNNLRRRLAEHGSGRTKAAQLIGKFRLLHVEELPNHGSTREREKFLKSGRGRDFLNHLYSGTGSASGG